MKKLLLLAGALAASLSANASASQKIISFAPAYRSSIDKSIENAGGRITRRFQLIDAVVADFPDNVRDAGLRAIRGVTHVDEDRYLKWIDAAPAPMSSVPLPSLGDALGSILSGEVPPPPAPSARPAEDRSGEVPWGVARLNAQAAWDYSTGKGVKVAVVDTGMDYTHPDLARNYKGGYNIVAGNNDPMDDQGHGTHVSGTIGATLDGKGVAGVAPGVDLYAVKVLDKNGSGQYSWIIAGIEWAVEHHMNVINMSLGGPQGTDALAQVMKKAKDAGVTVVCAAGNDGAAVNYPAKYPEAIAVSASDSSDKLAYFSSRGPEVAVIAPGVNIYSTRKGGGYTTMSGTSMASPHVAGLAALAIAAGANTPDKVRAALTAAASPLTGVTPAGQGAGMVDALRLVR